MKGEAKDASPSQVERLIALLRRLTPSLAGMILVSAILVFDFSRQTWRQEDGIQGPFVLATAAWLFWRNWARLEKDDTVFNTVLALPVLICSLGVFVLGRATDYITLEAAGTFGAGLAVFFARFGVKGLQVMWFPFLYLLFAVPPPAYILSMLTLPLKQGAASASTSVLAALGMPISHHGVTIIVAQYQLLVEDACSGMNSILGLTAICLLYIYLMRGSRPAYALFLAALAPPIAIMANAVRITAIILVTYAFGDEVGQSFIHELAGLLLFGAAFALVFALDSVLYPIAARLRKYA